MVFQLLNSAGQRLAPWIASVLLSTAIASGQLMLTPDCHAANEQAIRMLNEERNTDVGVLLAAHIARLGDSRQDRFCKGVLLFQFALSRERVGAFDEAELAAGRSLALLESEGGTNFSPLRRHFQFLANVAIDKKQYAKAEQLLKRADSIPGSDARDRAFENGSRASLALVAGRLEEAEKLGRLSYEERVRSGLGDSIDAAQGLSTLAICLIRQHRTLEAIRILEQCLGILTRSPDSPLTRAQTLIITAIASADQRDNRAAEDYYRQAIGVLPDLHPAVRYDLGRTLFTSYASFLRNAGRRRDAKAAEEQARTFGLDPSTAIVDVNSLMQKPRKR